MLRSGNFEGFPSKISLCMKLRLMSYFMIPAEQWDVNFVVIKGSYINWLVAISEASTKS